jgi:hypothetical protein
MLLLLEIILLAATACIYWMTRKLVADSNTNPAASLSAEENTEQLNAAQPPCA